ncbi:MAG: hypothetical protein ACOY45_15580 [Pseudomonadota bacterium]
MSLYDDFRAFLAREGITVAQFCRYTGFPATTLNSIRLAAAPKQATVDRLAEAIAAWKRGTPAASEQAPMVRPPQRQAPVFADDDWAKAAARATRAYLQALSVSGGRYAPGARMVEDTAAIRPAISRDPCPRCGVRGDIGCRHRPAMAEAWQ